MNELTLHIDESDWQEAGDDVEGGEPWHRLYGPTLNVAGGSLHFEAWAVEPVDGDEGQDRESYSDTQDRESYTVDEDLLSNGYAAVNPAWADAVEALYMIYEAALTPVRIRGHDYFLCAFPFGD